MAEYTFADALLVVQNWSWAIGSLIGDFWAFNADRHYSFFGRKTDIHPDRWPKFVPKKAPPVPDRETAIKKILDRAWKVSEPAAGIGRGLAGRDTNPRWRVHKQVWIGARVHLGPGIADQRNAGNVPFPGIRHRMSDQQASRFFGHQYRPVRPTQGLMAVPMANTSIAADWDLFRDIQRTNAVTFRGDKRTPNEIINVAEGMKPPFTRGNDLDYLKNTIYVEFAEYMRRRHGEQISWDDKTFARAVTKQTAAMTPQDRETLYAYTLWKRMVEKERAHLGRHVDNPAMKEFISTSKSLDKAMVFAVDGNTPGWVYVVIVHAGYVVPHHSQNWGTQEGEIAQFGQIPADRIVGFAHITPNKPYMPDSPIFLRTSFKRKEPEACDAMFEALSGKTP